jgi:hypothetical protein
MWVWSVAHRRVHATRIAMINKTKASTNAYPELGRGVDVLMARSVLAQCHHAHNEVTAAVSRRTSAIAFCTDE